MRRDFLHDLGNQALSVAAKGQVSDMNAIRSTMTDIGAVMEAEIGGRHRQIGLG